LNEQAFNTVSIASLRRLNKDLHCKSFILLEGKYEDFMGDKCLFVSKEATQLKKGWNQLVTFVTDCDNINCHWGHSLETEFHSSKIV